jgi:hypothetical protein
MAIVVTNLDVYLGIAEEALSESLRLLKAGRMSFTRCMKFGQRCWG